MMKKILILLVVSILAGAISLHAQTRLVRVTIPFEFTTISGTLAAGEYAIRLDDQGRVLVSDQQGQQAVWVLTTATSRTVIPEVITQWQPGATGGAAGIQKQKNSGSSQRRGTSGYNCVVFNRYGDRYFLHEIWTGYTGRLATISRAERAVQMAGIVKPQRLEFAALVP